MTTASHEYAPRTSEVSPDRSAAVPKSRAAADSETYLAPAEVYSTPPRGVGGSVISHSAKWERRLLRRVATVDALSVVIATGAVLAVAPLVEISAPLGALGVIGALAAAAWLASAAWSRRSGRGLTGYGRVRYLPPLTGAGVAFLTASVALALSGQAIPIALLVSPLLVGAAAGLAGRAVVRSRVARAHDNGIGRRTVLLVGTSSEISAFGPALDAIGSAVEVLGACVTDEYGEPDILLDYEAHSKASVQTITVLGSADELLAIAERVEADTVLLASTRHAAEGGLSGLAWQLDQIGTRLSLLSSTNDIDDSRVQREAIGGSTLVHISRPTYRGALAAAKRAFDLLGSAALLLVFGLPMLVIAAVIRLSSRGGVLFKQERVGLAGEHFTMLKFRSMVIDAEDRLAELEAQQDAGNAVMFKMRDDPRVTAIGRLLRKTSLDELPQIINVLRGDMSLVGPRPPLPAELQQYDEIALRRFLVKPGITGLWQVSGRSDLTWEQTVRCDRRYVENWSLGKDASILVRTVRAMNKGAY